MNRPIAIGTLVLLFLCLALVGVFDLPLWPALAPVVVFPLVALACLALCELPTRPYRPLGSVYADPVPGESYYHVTPAYPYQAADLDTEPKPDPAPAPVAVYYGDLWREPYPIPAPVASVPAAAVVVTAAVDAMPAPVARTPADRFAWLELAPQGGA